MNQVVQELVYKADPEIYDKLDRYVLDAFLEKFTKRVIADCRQIAWEEAYSDENAEEICFAIDHHFEDE